MRGKKADPVFISEFMQESIQEGFETPAQIVERAKRIVGEIDKDIREIVSKKIRRSKLLDVISTFENSVKDKTEEAKMLPFFKIQYPQTCREICELLKHEVKSLSVMSWASVGPGAAEHNFCIKQMIEAKVITRVGDQLVRGERFDEYMKFVLREI